MKGNHFFESITVNHAEASIMVGGGGDRGQSPPPPPPWKYWGANIIDNLKNS